MEKIFTDESNETTPPSLQIDFSETLWATDKLNSIFHTAGIPLSDVDFIAETEEELIFVECKNANRIDAANPDFNPADDKRLTIIARKYYDSLNFCMFSERGLRKRKIYCFIVEAKLGSLTLRNYWKVLLAKRLPFELQKQNPFPIKMIDELNVMSIGEWNKKYPQFPITRLIEEICPN